MAIEMVSVCLCVLITIDLSWICLVLSWFRWYQIRNFGYIFCWSSYIIRQMFWSIVTHTYGIHIGRVFTAVCLLVFPDGISKTDAARITKLDIQMFRDESWKPFILGSKG